MTAFLLKNGADVNQRCYGAFFCSEDQKSSRTDSVEHEYVELSIKTEYTGYAFQCRQCSACVRTLYRCCMRHRINHKRYPMSHSASARILA